MAVYKGDKVCRQTGETPPPQQGLGHLAPSTYYAHSIARWVSSLLDPQCGRGALSASPIKAYLGAWMCTRITRYADRVAQRRRLKDLASSRRLVRTSILNVEVQLAPHLSRHIQVQVIHGAQYKDDEVCRQIGTMPPPQQGLGRTHIARWVLSLQLDPQRGQGTLSA
jgi:hypothetical protein